MSSNMFLFALFLLRDYKMLQIRKIHLLIVGIFGYLIEKSKFFGRFENNIKK